MLLADGLADHADAVPGPLGSGVGTLLAPRQQPARSHLLGYAVPGCASWSHASHPSRPTLNP